MQKALTDVEQRTSTITTLPQDAERPVSTRVQLYATVGMVLVTGPFNDGALQDTANICNGFQVLVKSGLLPWGRADQPRPPTATPRWRGTTAGGSWTDGCGCGPTPTSASSSRKARSLALPIAHGEGKFVPRDEQVLEKIRAGGQAALRYDGDNPNGSVDDIAGNCDPTGRIFGLDAAPRALRGRYPAPHLDPRRR